MPTFEPDALLTGAEVAAILRVDPKTVSRWATAGRIRSITTPAVTRGHRRYFKADIDALLDGRPVEATLPRKAVAS